MSLWKLLTPACHGVRLQHTVRNLLTPTRHAVPCHAVLCWPCRAKRAAPLAAGSRRMQQAGLRMRAPDFAACLPALPLPRPSLLCPLTPRCDALPAACVYVCLPGLLLLRC